MKKPRSIDYAKTNREQKIEQIFQNWMSVGRESMRVGGVHWMKGAFGAPILHGTDQRLEVAGGHDSSAVDGYATIVALALAISALGDLIHC